MVMPLGRVTKNHRILYLKWLNFIICKVYLNEADKKNFFNQRAMPKNVQLLLLLSHFSRVQLCATPETAAHQAPLSMGFARQEYWSGLPLPSLKHFIRFA